MTDHAWMFPVICLPFSLLVGLLVKYAKAPSNLDGSILDSLTGDVMHLRWKDLPATVATSLASLFSGAVLGPEGAIGNIASKIAALYCDLLRIPADRRPKLVFASVASGYNGLLENPVFAAVLGTEVAETKKQGLSTLPASLIGGASATPSSCCCTRPGSWTSCTCRRCRATPCGTPSSWCRWRWPARPRPPHRALHARRHRLLRPPQGARGPASAGRRRDLQRRRRARAGHDVLRRDAGADGDRGRRRLRRSPCCW